MYAQRENSGALKKCEIERNDEGSKIYELLTSAMSTETRTQTKPYFSSGLAQRPCPFAFKIVFMGDQIHSHELQIYDTGFI